VFVLVLLAAVPHLILGGAGIDRLLVQIPAWHRIGPVAFAHYARVADMGNGYYLYPLLGISGPVFTWAALAVTLGTGAGTRIWVPLAVASVLCILHTLTTTQAAPTMMRVGRVEDRPELIAPLLDRFTLWSWPRAILQVLTAATLLWVLIAR
jgi:hypothetical protein